MGQRQKARQLVLKCLYAFETAEQDIDQIASNLLPDSGLNADSVKFAETVFRFVVAHLVEIDDHISRFSDNWEIERLAIIDKNIIRIGICELLYFPDIPGRVSINEAVELAKRFSTPESSRFVNGVVDAVFRSQESEQSENE